MKGFIRGNINDTIYVEKVKCDDSIYRYKDLNKEDTYYEIKDVVLLESDKFLVVNRHSVPVNVSHFQGTSRDRLAEFMEMVKEKTVLELPENLTVLTTFTDADSCILYQQLKSNGVECLNTCDFVSQEELKGDWSMLKKIGLIRKGLEHVTTDYVLICDGYDVYINSFDNIIPKFLETGLRMLFNGTKNNFPLTHVDKIPYRDWREDYRYFNAGCAIGYVEDFKNFYKDCDDLINQPEPVPNPWNSEQLILRHVFAKYSEKVDTPEAYMDFDWKCDIFQTYVNAAVLKLYNGQNIFAVI